MASIATSIELYDRVSKPVNGIIRALNGMCDIFDDVESSMAGGFDSSAIDKVRRAVDQTAAEVVQLGNEIEQNESRQRKFNDSVDDGGTSVGNLAKKFAGMVAAIGIGNVVKQEVSKAIDYASDLTEVQNVVDVVFGQNSMIDSWAKTTLNAVGLNELSAKQFAGTMGAMLSSSGVAKKEVESMSMSLSNLAGDMASFYNLEGQEAFDKLRAGISGETEPLKQLGINMSVANLEAYALSQGIKTSYADMNQAAQTTLRYNYILSATQNAQGDFARTTDSFSNQTKLLKENWSAFTGELASKALPTLGQIIAKVNAFVSNLSAYTPTFVAIGSVIFNILGGILGAVGTVVGFIIENWSIIAPILTGVAVALGLINAPLIVQAGLWLWNSILVPAYTAVLTFLKIGYGVLTGSTAAASAAQFVYNNALLACPLTWILLIIIAVIAAIYAIVAAINKVTGKTTSATGVILGAIMTAVAAIWNTLLGLLDLVLGIISALWNKFAMFANFFGNVFTDPIGSIIHLFGDMADYVLGVVETIASALDKVFGSNMAGTVAEWRGSLDAKVEAAASKYGNGKYEEKVSKTKLTSESLGLKRWAYKDAYNTGYGWGEGIDSKVSGMFGGNGTNQIENLLNAENYTKGYDEANMPENIAGIKEDTGDVKDSVEITSEDLKYLRDIAEKEVVNRFTTAEIKVDMTNNNNISSGMDLDGVVNYLVTGVNEAMNKAAEGVHV